MIKMITTKMMIIMIMMMMLVIRIRNIFISSAKIDFQWNL